MVITGHNNTVNDKTTDKKAIQRSSKDVIIVQAELQESGKQRGDRMDCAEEEKMKNLEKGGMENSNVTHDELISSHSISSAEPIEDAKAEEEDNNTNQERDIENHR
ncbi:hypothetical protein HAX54_027906 [Datura stramonium]|uniref:Uncharacterized protein n=1 Tax=Datura stramonium TaxID=4076 RepID=A0ABS8V395_DATST|nr:hypothetical protein [Datura stramonium]